MDASFDSLLSGKTAVIVAVEAIQTMHLRRVLSRAGVQVLDPVTTEEIRSIAEGHRPDFILLDVDVLPDDGTELNPYALAAPDSHLILLSHLPEPQNHALVSAWGAYGFLTKPVGREQILACLEEAIRSRQ